MQHILRTLSQISSNYGDLEAQSGIGCKGVRIMRRSAWMIAVLCLYIAEVDICSAQDTQFMSVGSDYLQLIKQKHPVNDGGTLTVNAELGSIQIESWEHNEVNILIEKRFTGRNEERARQAFEHHDVVISRIGNDVEIQIVNKENVDDGFFGILKWLRQNDIYVNDTSHKSIPKHLSAKTTVWVPESYNLNLKTIAREIKTGFIRGFVKAHSLSGTITLNTTSGDVTVSTTTGDIKTNVVHGSVKAKSLSGRIALNAISGDVRVSTTTGDIKTNVVKGSTEAKSLSGNIQLGSTHEGVDVSTTTGDINTNTVQGSVKAKSLSGNIQLGSTHGDVFATATTGDIETLDTLGDVKAKVLSGDIRLGTTRGDVDASLTSGDFEPGNALGSVRYKSLGGNIKLHNKGK